MVDNDGCNLLKCNMDMQVDYSTKGTVNTQTRHVIISSLISMIFLFKDSPGLLKNLSVNGDRRFLLSWYFFKKNRTAAKRK